jgi:hypothetical protein
MTKDDAPKQERINQHINASLKVMLAEMTEEDMPDEITDLLNVLRAQDAELKDKK